jgi:Predicted membrane protein
MLGGIISSTNVTLSLARMSRVEDSARIPLAYGVIAASAVMFVRVGIATAVLNPTTAQAVVPYFAVRFFAAACMAFWGVWKYRGSRSAEEAVANPLQLWTAVQMALLFQVVLFAVRWLRVSGGKRGYLFPPAFSDSRT